MAPRFHVDEKLFVVDKIAFSLLSLVTDVSTQRELDEDFKGTKKLAKVTAGGATASAAVRS